MDILVPGLIFVSLGLAINYALTKAAVRNGMVEAHHEINGTKRPWRGIPATGNKPADKKWFELF